MSPLSIPQSADQLTPEWVHAMFAEHFGQDVPQVTGVETSIIGQEKGFLSQVVRVAVQYDGPRGDLPESIIAKLEPEAAVFRDAAQELHAFAREIRFYTEVAASAPLRLPRMFLAKQTDEGSILVMEDLGGLAGGDQILGLRHEQVIATVEHIARLHARYWNNEALRKLEWMPEHDLFFEEGYAAHWPAFVDAYGLRIGKQAVRIGERVAETLDWIEQQIAARPMTIVHGDLRADNLIFGQTGTVDEVLIIDWQLINRTLGTLDIARLMGGSEPAAERKGHQLEVFAAWHETLVREGVTDYRFEEGLDDFRLGILHALFIPVKVFFLCGDDYGGREGRLRDAITTRIFASAVELEADSVLP